MASAVPPGESFDEWFARANAAGGGNFDPNSAESRAQYQQHLYTLQNPGQGGGFSDASAYGGTGDPTGMRAYGAQYGMSEDFGRLSNAQLASWEPQKDVNCPPNTPYRAFDGSGCVEKPIDSNNPGPGGGGGGGGGWGGAGGSYSTGGVTGWGSGTAGSLPQFQAPVFTPPSYSDALSDPGYQFSLKQGVDTLENSAAARGTLRTGGTLKDILGYGQDRAAQQYGDVYNRAANTFGINYQGKKDEFAPQYGGWTTMYGGDLSKYLQQQQDALSRWSTKYGGDLSLDLQKRGQIFDLVNQPPPAPPTWA